MSNTQELTGSEAKTLLILLRADEPVPMETFLDELYDGDRGRRGHVRVFITRLRRKIEHLGVWIDSHRGRGWQLIADEDQRRQLLEMVSEHQP